MLFDRTRVSAALARLASESRIFLGTCSWKFPGWCGTLYDEERYLWGTHFSKKRFNEHCLSEFVEVFRSVEVDSTYYALPKMGALKTLADQAPEGFKFSFKVPDQITIRNFPMVKSFGDRAGKPNDFFLSEGLFSMGFLRHLEEIREKVGLLIFEFSHFHADDFTHGREFVEHLDRFFSAIPVDWDYGIEIRNRNLLHPDYFAVLKAHGVAHVYNQWTMMPPVTEQLAMHPVSENPFPAARFLLTPGRSFKWAQEHFEPFNRICEIDNDARDSLTALLQSSLKKPETASYLYVGNDLEGNALHTIADVLEAVTGRETAD